MTDQVETQSAEQRMMALLESEDAFTEEVPDEQEAEEEPTEEVEEGEQEESDEEEPQATVKLKVNGEEIEKPLDEVVSLAQQGMDYTQKTQALAEQRREVETYAQAIKAQEQQFQQQVQLQQALITDIAKVTAIDQQLAQYGQVNWQALSDQDPVEAQKLFFTYTQLQNQRQQMVGELSGKQQQIQQAQQQRLAEEVKRGQEVLTKEIPGWSKETALELRSIGKEYGFSDEELGSIVDPRHVKVLWEAAQWRKLQKNPTVGKKVAQAKPMLKPGSKDPKQANSSQAKQLSEALKKTGKQEYAQKLIERML